MSVCRELVLFIVFIVSLEIFFCLQRKNKAKSSCSPTTIFPIPLFVALAPVHIYMNRSIYMSVSSCIYSTWLLTCFLFRLHPGSSYSQSRFCSGQNISQSVRVYITRLLTCFVTYLFSFFRRPPFIISVACWLPEAFGILCPICIGFNLSFAIPPKVCFRVQSYGTRTLHKKRLTIFGEIWRKLSAITDYVIS